MQAKRKIKVLVVDDSPLFREVLSRGIATDDELVVVDTAKDPYDATNKILKYRPDVMTCDIQMPRMDGIEFIRQLLPQYPIPVIVISTISGAVFDAMNAGAVDFIAKPNINSADSVESFIYELIYKIKAASTAKVVSQKTAAPAAESESRAVVSYADKIIAIGASTGGTEAISQVISSLPRSMPGIVIVQHIPPMFSRMFAQKLDATSLLEVKEARNGDYVEPGKVLIAPGDRHMRVRKIGDRYKVECFEGEKVNGHCPSVDVLFDSVARAAGANAIGIILTGMGYDGAKGLLEMKKHGAKTIGQDEASSVVYGMPKVAYNIGAVQKQVPLDHIAATLISMLQ